MQEIKRYIKILIYKHEKLFVLLHQLIYNFVVITKKLVKLHS